MLLIALTLYVALGYIAVPVLFQFLPKPQAGEIAGVYLAIAHWEMVMMVLLAWGLSFKFLLAEKVTAWRLHLQFILLILIELGQIFRISPEMKALKLQALAQTGLPLTEASPQWAQFAQLHGISQLLYLLTCFMVLKFLLFFSKSRA